MKIVITGCAGFIGANFTNYWLKTYKDDIVVGIDALTYAANIRELERLKTNSRFVFYKNNICDFNAIDLIFKKEKPDAIVNFAAESHVDNSIVDSKIFIESNVLGVQCLLDVCLKNSVRRFHQISTDEVYGDLPLDSLEKFNETSILKPSSPYSASKAAADLLVLSYGRTHNLCVTISRSSNNYGILQHSEKLIPHTIDCILSGKPITLYGDGENIRDWIFVEEHCRAVDAILHSEKYGEIYNIGANQELSNFEIVRRISDVLSDYNPVIEFVEDRKGHDRKYSLDITKIKSTLFWQPTNNFKDSIADIIGWYKTQKDKN